MRNIWNYENVKKFVEIDSNSGCELLSKSFNKVNDVLLIQCSCGETFNVSFNKFLYRNKRRCNKCGFKLKGLWQKYTYDEIKYYIEIESNSGCELISKEYINNSTPILIQCSCGNTFQTRFTDFKYKNKHTCNICSKKEKYTFEYVKSYIESFGFILLSTEYKNNMEDLFIMCLEGHIFKRSFNHFLLRSQQCPICYSLIDKSGENCHLWQGGITELNNHLRGLFDDWKKRSFSIYNFKCAITNVNNSKLEVHHLYSFNKIVKETLDKLNLPIKERINEYTNDELKLIEEEFLQRHNELLGVPLHEKIHLLYHRLYNYDNTPKQFKEFVTRLRLGEFNNFLEENNLELNINYDVINSII